MLCDGAGVGRSSLISLSYKLAHSMGPPTSEQSPLESRISKRFRVELPVSFSLEDPPGEGNGTAYNLSAGGCKVTSATPVSSGLYLTIRLHLPNEPLPLEVRLAAIRWAMAEDFGVAFLSLETHQHERLRQLLTDLETGAPV